MGKLVACKDCGAKVSRNAKACPQCGSRRFRGGSPLVSGCLLVVLGLFLLGGLGSWLAPSHRQPSSSPSATPASATPAAGLRIGAKLISQNGEVWGTVVEMSDSHRFDDGTVEAGVLVDYGPRMGDPPVPPQWLPKRSALRFTIQ
jgi:hypothetical protein